MSNEEYCTGENLQKSVEYKTPDGNEASALRRPNERNNFAQVTQLHNATVNNLIL